MYRIVPIHYNKLVKVFQNAGFLISRTKGDHIIMVKNDVRRLLVIPKVKQVPVFIIRNNLRSAGVSRDEYLKYLEKVSKGKKPLNDETRNDRRCYNDEREKVKTKDRGRKDGREEIK